MEVFDFKGHWNKAYSSKPVETLGWYEHDVSPTIRLIDRPALAKNSSILIVGAGSTTLVDELIDKQYSNIIASDISEKSLELLKQRLGSNAGSVKWIVDDLTSPHQLSDLEQVDLWIDRAVLHFFTEEKDQNTYFDLLKKLVKRGGHVLLAEFSLDGAPKCSGLPVHRYDNKMFEEHLGDSFELVETFNHVYTMPSGDLRPYVYSLYKRVS